MEFGEIMKVSRATNNLRVREAKLNVKSDEGQKQGLISAVSEKPRN